MSEPQKNDQKQESKKPIYKMRVNVIHDGKPYDKDSECPEGLVKEFGSQGLIEEIGLPKPSAQAQGKPAAQPKDNK